jgi:hypothetical protein
MKLRIQGDSLRLRLTQREVAELREGGCVQSSLHFASGRSLTYSIASSGEASQVEADFDGGSIRVMLPRAAMVAWADGDQTGISGPPDQPSSLLIEKDFQCLHKPGEQDPEAYPNPLAEALGNVR